MTAEMLCEESDPLICTDTSFLGSEQQLALMLQVVLKFRTLLICPTSCPLGTQHTAPKKVFPVHIHALLSTDPVVGSSCTHHKHLLPECFFAVPFSPKALTGWELHTFPGFAQCIFQNSLSAEWGGFWRGLYDLAVEMPLSSHLLTYLPPRCEPALLRMRLVPHHHPSSLIPVPIQCVPHFLSKSRCAPRFALTARGVLTAF